MITDLSEYLFHRNNYADSVFSSLTDEQRQLLESSFELKRIKKGGLIFKEGESPKGLIFLTEGSAKVFIRGVGNREQIVRLVKPMMFVGYKALFAEKNHATNAEAIEDCVVKIYDKKVLFQIIDRNPGFARGIIKALALELGFNFNRIISLTQKHIRGRMAETLLVIKEIYGLEPDGKTLKAQFTRENIAQFSNMTTANAIRVLKIFTEEGIITTSGKGITLLNAKALEKISQMG